MPQRANVRTFDSADVQGEGSYIRLRPMTLGEMLALQSEAAERRTLWYKLGRWLGRLFRKRPSPVEVQRQNMERVFQYVRDWNWVDDDGNPLPDPINNPRALINLTLEEMRFINACVNGERQSEEQKN